jgi:hypothetical protein
MGKDYLAQLPVEDSVRRKIEELDAPTPIALLSILRSSPEAFDSHVGQNVRPELEEALKRIVPEHEQNQIFSMPRRNFPLGARLDSPDPAPTTSESEIAERNALFEELESLRKSEDRSSATEEKVQALEKQIAALLKR